MKLRASLHYFCDGARWEQLVGELAQIQKQQRDTFGQIEAANDQFNRLDALWKKLNQRRSGLEEIGHTLSQRTGGWTNCETRPTDSHARGGGRSREGVRIARQPDRR